MIIITIVITFSAFYLLKSYISTRFCEAMFDYINIIRQTTYSSNLYAKVFLLNVSAYNLIEVVIELVAQ